MGVWGRVLCLCLSLFVLGSGALSACEVPDLRTDQRPAPEAGPTRITASFVVADLLGIDDVNQQLELDMRGKFTWRDPRLAGAEGCRFKVTEVWFPNLNLFNSSHLRTARTNARNQVAVGPDGQVSYIQRYTGAISSYHDLRAFPFDNHAFEIEIGSLDSGVDDLELIADDANTWISDKLNIEGWDVEGVSLTSGPQIIEQETLETSVLTLQIRADRNPDYYLYRVMSLLVFVVAMSWAIFWVPPTRFEFQIGLGATAMLTTIAFTLSLSARLPQLGYLTVLDKMLVWAIFLVFLSIIEALVAGLWVLKGHERPALRLDRICRVAFPALLFGGWGLITAMWI